MTTIHTALLDLQKAQHDAQIVDEFFKRKSELEHQKYLAEQQRLAEEFGKELGVTNTKLDRFLFEQKQNADAMYDLYTRLEKRVRATEGAIEAINAKLGLK
jgi:hypothetical protein